MLAIISTGDRSRLGLNLAVVGQPDERLERDDPDEAGVRQVLGERAGRVVVAQRPAVAAEHLTHAGLVRVVTLEAFVRLANNGEI